MGIFIMKKTGRYLLFSFFLLTCLQPRAQFLMDMVDTTKDVGRGILGVYKKYDHLRIGGYLQPQFQLAQEKGIKTFEGTDFNPQVSNRFIMRRSRVRMDYVHYDNVRGPGVQIVFQFDANERSFTVRDMWGRVFDNRFKLFALTMGMFARPFGYEVNLSSSDRESPERGRMSQLLMKSERDLGAMVSFDPRKKIGFLSNIKFDLGVFNGQGINAAAEFDNSKDLITRLSLKPLHLSKAVTLSAGLSHLNGALLHNTRYQYVTLNNSGIKSLVLDSSAGILNTRSPRIYSGADVQFKIKNRVGFTEFRAEFIGGKQTGTRASTETPGVLLMGRDGFYARNFSGGYFYFLQHLFSERHQLILKYDFYDANTDVKGQEIGRAGTGFGAADIRYNTFGVGYINHINDNTKLVIYHAFVRNEHTALSGYTQDLQDDVTTFRLQFRF